MRGTIVAASAILLGPILAVACQAAPVVSEVIAHQRTDGSKSVDIYYDLAYSGTLPLTVSVNVSSDGGSTYTISPSLLTGDAGANVTKGSGKHIVWDTGADLPGAYGTNYKVSLIASEFKYTGEMVYISAGSFLMGNTGIGLDVSFSSIIELPQHAVYLSGYYIGKYEVTRCEYRAFIDAGGYSNASYWSTRGWSWRQLNNRTQPDYWATSQNWGSPPGAFAQTDNHPVVGVSYYEAEAFCNWAGGHLPTEAQWEKAARRDANAGSPSVFPWGDVWDEQKCNNWGDALYPGYQTAPIGRYPSGVGPSGCQDSIGNVWEWCADWFLSDYYSQMSDGGWSNPQGPGDGICRVLRGGSWHSYDGYGGSGRCAYRGNYAPSYCANGVGFRLAR